MISVSIKKRLRNLCRVRESADVLRKIRLHRKMCLDSTYSGLKTLRQVSLYLSDLEMNWTSSFLVQNDKLAIVLHWLFVMNVRLRERRDAFR